MGRGKVGHRGQALRDSVGVQRVIYRPDHLNASFEAIVSTCGDAMMTRRLKYLKIFFLCLSRRLGVSPVETEAMATTPTMRGRGCRVDASWCGAAAAAK